MQSKHIKYLMFGEKYLVGKLINCAVKYIQTQHAFCSLGKKHLIHYSKLEVNWTCETSL